MRTTTAATGVSRRIYGGHVAKAPVTDSDEGRTVNHVTGWSRREFLKHSVYAGGLIVAGPTLISACGGGGERTVESLAEEGTITVGIAGEEPYGFQEGGELTGMDPTVQQRIWNNLGIENVEATQVGFEGLIPGLNADRFDVVAAGMFINADRCEQVDFSDPMYCAPNAFLVPTGNPENISDFESVASAGITIGVFGGAVEGDYAEAAGVEEGNIQTMPDQRTAIVSLQQGRIDAIALTSITLQWILQQDPSLESDIELTEPFIPVLDGEEVIGCGGAVFRQEDDELRQAFNEELGRLMESGEFRQLVEEFGFTEETDPAEFGNPTTDELCGA